MTITPEIKAAILKAIDLHGNVTQFAKHLGIAHSTVLFWLSGKTTIVSGRLWAQKLRPALAPWLTPGVVPPSSLPQAPSASSGGEMALPEGYRPWETLADFERGSVVRLRDGGRVLGIILPFDARQETMLKLVVRENDCDGTPPLMVVYPRFALELLEILVDGKWLPAGKRAEA